MKQFGLGKSHKLCSTIAIDKLFADADATAALAFPLRAVWHHADRRNQVDAPAKFLISVPKKRLRHAVDRVAMRRRIREAYRLNHSEFDANADNIDIAFVYVANDLKSYASIQRAMRRLLQQIHSLDEPAKVDK